LRRDVAQPGSAHAWGAWGRRFKSSRPDHCFDGLSHLKQILLTNDDGVHSAGLLALAKAFSTVGTVTLVAPDRERSASSQSLSLHRPVRFEEVAHGRFAVEGTPTDCVLIALHHIMRLQPDLVISGINRGWNLGHDIAYSGTVSAALEAANHDIPAVAVSTASWDELKLNDAAEFVLTLAKRMWTEPLIKGHILNVNVPSKETRGVRLTRQGHRNVRTLVVENKDPRGRKYFWFDQELQAEGLEDGPDVDYMAVKAGYISVTPLRIDRTAQDCIGRLSAWPEALFKEKLSLIQ
jgi:5'-nucleotidase